MQTNSRNSAHRWQRALLLADSEELRDVLSRHLSTQGLLLDLAAEQAEAEIHLAHRAPDIMVLAVGPHSQIRDFIRQWRRYAQTPILAVATEGAIPTLLLEMGADDVVEWPIVVDEFVARVKALLRRSVGIATHEGCIGLAEGILLDVGDRSVVVGEHRTALTPGEFRLLLTVGRQSGRICSARELGEAVWGSAYYSNGDALRALVKRLRAKLGVARELVQVERGHGYRLSVVAARAAMAGEIQRASDR
jgi:DNA-binding response OmpR family regulator